MLISKITYFWPSLNPCALIALRHFVVKNDIANIMQRPKNLYFFRVQSLHTVLWQTNIFCQNFQKTNPHQIIFLPFRQSSLNWMSPWFLKNYLWVLIWRVFQQIAIFFSFFKPTVLLVRFTIKPSVMHYVHYMQIYSRAHTMW